MSDLPPSLREVLPDGWRLSMWPWMQDWPDGTQREMGTYYTLATIHEGHKIGYTVLIGSPLKRQPWFPKYEREQVVAMVKAIRKEIANKEGGDGWRRLHQSGRSTGRLRGPATVAGTGVECVG